MSLVNQVLKDLQHRRSDHPDTSGLLATDAVGQSRPRNRWLPLGAAAIAVGLLAFAAQHYFAREPAAPPVQPAQIVEPSNNVGAAPLRGDAEVAAPAEPEVVESAPAVTEPESSQATSETVGVVTEPEVVVEVAPETVSATPIRRDPLPESVPSLTRTLVTTTPRQRADEAYNQGVRALSEGRRDTAETQFRSALGHDTSHVDARLALANLLAAQGALRDAEAQLQQGLRIAPDAAPLAERYARLLFERGDLAGAIGVLVDAAPPLATNPDYHALLAALQQRAGNHASAADTYAALVDVRPGEGLWWVGLGISLEAEQRPEAALNAYRQAARDSRVTTAVADFIRERIAVLEP